jgi:hypothetical protein
MYRLNMAFELGIDFGCRLFAGGKAKSKKFLVLQTMPTQEYVGFIKEWLANRGVVTPS